MKKLGSKIWFYFLRSLLHTKKGVFSVFRLIAKPLVPIINLINEQITFRLLKIFYKLRIRFGPNHLPWSQKLAELLTRRGFFQIIIVIFSVFIIFPHSSAFRVKSTGLPGQNTLLYKLAGPGTQDFSLSEITMETTPLTQKNNPSWRSGTVESSSSGQAPMEIVPTDIGSIIIGGGAITKPSILPGSNLPTGSNTNASNNGRSDIINYTIQGGDTIGSIAERFNISVQTILWANNLTIRSLIRPDSILKILPISGVLHKVIRGETVQKIAKTYGVDAAEIIKYNKLQKDGSDIKIGEELIIPNGNKPAPVVVPASTVRKYTNLSNVAAPPPSVSAPAGTNYLWPAGVRRISQYYGWRHTGLDIAGPIGTALYATRSGTVIKSQCGWNGGYGCYVIIDHGGGIQSLYGHASQLFVNVGESVTQGQTIAAMGSTGRSTGPHIHFEIRVNGARLNPLKYIR